jgi:hypothetical protein
MRTRHVDRIVEQIEIAVGEDQLDLDLRQVVEEGRHDRRDVAAAELHGAVMRSTPRTGASERPWVAAS